MNELNPTNAFGELLLDLIDAQYGGDYDAGVEALVESTGLSEEEVVAIIQGDVIVDDESLLSNIVDAFPEADEDDLEVIINVASGVDEEDRQELIASMEEEMGQMAESDVPMEAAPAEYSRQYPQANFSNTDYVQQLENKVTTLQNQFSNFQAYEGLSRELQELDHEAKGFVEQAIIPPSYKSMLIGNFSSPEERVARFSEMAQTNGVDVNTMLFATKYALGMLRSSAPFMEFRDFSVSEEEVATANFSASLDQQCRADLDAIFNS